MALASDLIGLGMPPLLALKIAQGGTGPVTITAAGVTFATSAKLGANQSMVTCTNGDNTKSIGLPVVGTDNGALVADDYTINNNGTDTVVLRTSTGVIISAAGAADSKFSLGVNKTIALYPLTAILWVGIGG